jgi:uncharacterized RDD family membrane protein YckC
MSRPEAAPTIAGVGIRLGAFAIDMVGTALLTGVIAAVLLFAGLATPGTLDGVGAGVWFATVGALAVLVVPLAAIALYALLTARRGASPGQRILRLTVVNLESHGPVGFGCGMLRTVVLFAPALLALALRLGSAFLAALPGDSFDLYGWAGTLTHAVTVTIPLWWILLAVQLATGRRALHDRAAGTMVLAWRVRRL